MKSENVVVFQLFSIQFGRIQLLVDITQNFS